MAPSRQESGYSLFLVANYSLNTTTTDTKKFIWPFSKTGTQSLHLIQINAQILTVLHTYMSGVVLAL